MANLNRSWKRVMAIGCTHGDLVHPQALKDALAFRRRFKPEVRFHLGDMVDTACFRGGAAGTKDEARSPRDDMARATELIREYEPTHVAWGNHDWRLAELATHPKAIIATLAGDLWGRLSGELRNVKAKTVGYDIEDGWFELGGVAWGHGYVFNVNALRDTAETNGMPTVMAHLHSPHTTAGRTRRNSLSFCVGALADEKQLTYGRRKRASLQHKHGLVFGEICNTEARLWLAQSQRNGTPLEFPPGL